MLELFPWSIYAVKVWLIETDGDLPEKDSAVRKLLRMKGYVEMHHGLIKAWCQENRWSGDCTSNTLFVHPELAAPQ